MQLDLDTGGGLPAGGLSYISGPDNAGKTFLVMLYMLMHQKLYGERSALAYGCVEGGFDFARAINMGLKIAVPDEVIDEWSRERVLRGMPPYTSEEWAFFKQKVGEFIILRGATGEQLLNTTLDAIRSKIFGIIAIDSISAVLPEADASKDLDDPTKRSAAASLVTQFMAHYYPLTTGLDGINRTTTIFTAQVRANQERANAPSAMQKYIKKWESTGAYAARHAKLIDVSVWDGGNIKKAINGKDATVGKISKYELIKGKAGAHDNVSGEFPFYYPFWMESGVDTAESIILAGMKRGVILEHHGKFDVIDTSTGEVTDIKDVPSYDAFKRMMELDFDFELAVRRHILASKGIKCLYR
jgi:RecA/RadA recombinase